jgi:hypothetical protein
MRVPARWVSLIAGMLVLGMPGMAGAQGIGSPTIPNLTPLTLPSSASSATGLGSLVAPPGQLLGADQQQQQTTPDGAINITDSYVSIIDGAVPRNMFILGFDAAYDIRQPTRAEYMFAKGGLPGSPGFPLIETKIDYQQASTHAEYALTSWFSMFMEIPYRWLNPDVNRNERGFADMCYGFRLCTWSSPGDNFIATIMLRLYQPTADPSTLGTSHWSVEPGVLAACKITDQILLEGELRYWTAIGGSDFAGDLVRYGLGISYGQRNPSGFWFTPVVECVGWTVLSGQTILANSPTNYVIENARNQTIVNAYLGLRLGYGPIDLYLGYGRCFTGDQWMRDFYRAELRFVY